MAIAPSNNLLSALSQLQGSARPAASAKPSAGAQRVSFSSQITGPAPTAPTASASAPAPASSAASNPAPVQSLPRQAPVPSRGGYLGQYVNIVV